ncbi:MAG: glutamate racemase [Desulfomonilaceae bacterium]
MKDGSGFIGIFDSGVGGLSVWREVVCQLPYASTLYLADQAHVPYGSRSLKEVRDFAEGITRFLLAQGAKIIVIASNTTSAAALYPLRNLFPDVPFVGMEPAIKPAIERTRTGVVGVIATSATFQGELFANLVRRYTNGVSVVSQACPGLVEAVEMGALDSPETAALLERYLSPMIEAEVDQLVLGCTHYPFLRPIIDQWMGPGAEVIDPAPSVARQVAHILAKAGRKATSDLALSRNRNFGDRHIFYTSGDTAAFAKMIKRLLSPLTDVSLNVRPVAWQAGLELIS